MVPRAIPIIVMTTVVLALVSAAQMEVGPGGGPTQFGPRPERPFGPPQPPVVLREYADVLRARAREAQELANRLQREADGLDRLAGAPFGPGMGPREMDPGQGEMAEMKGQVERLRGEAARAKGEGRLEESQRLWDEAQNIEMKLMRQQQVREMAENVGAMKRKAAIMRQQSMQAEQEGRHQEAREFWEKAEQLDRDARGGLEKIERFKVDSEIKDLGVMAERAKKQGDDRKAQALLDEARQRKERVNVGPKSPQDSDLMRMVEELRGEVKQLRRELDEVRAQSGGSKPL